MSLLDNIKVVAKNYGYSLSEINDKANLGKNTIYSWKTKKPSIENLQKVAKVLHTSTDYLLGNTDDSKLSTKEKHKNIDISDTDNIYSYNGKPIPEEYLDVIRGLMDSDFKKGRKNGKFD